MQNSEYDIPGKGGGRDLTDESMETGGIIRRRRWLDREPDRSLMSGEDRRPEDSPGERTRADGLIVAEGRRQWTRLQANPAGANGHTDGRSHAHLAYIFSILR